MCFPSICVCVCIYCLHLKCLLSTWSYLVLYILLNLYLSYSEVNLWKSLRGKIMEGFMVSIHILTLPPSKPIWILDLPLTSSVFLGQVIIFLDPQVDLIEFITQSDVFVPGFASGWFTMNKMNLFVLSWNLPYSRGERHKTLNQM